MFGKQVPHLVGWSGFGFNRMLPSYSGSAFKAYGLGLAEFKDVNVLLFYVERWLYKVRV